MRHQISKAGPLKLLELMAHRSSGATASRGCVLAAIKALCALLNRGCALIALIPPRPTPNAGIPPSVTQNTAIVGEVRYSKKNADRRVKVSIIRNSNSSECDVIVAVRDRKVVVRLPDYGLAVKWAQMELRSYGLPAEFAEEAPLDREPDHELGK
jgi:hypothetical protein